MTQKELARRLGIHYKYLNRILNGFRPSVDLAIRIEKESEGQYKAKQLRPDLSKIHRKIGKVL